MRGSTVNIDLETLEFYCYCLIVIFSPNAPRPNARPHRPANQMLTAPLEGDTGRRCSVLWLCFPGVVEVLLSLPDSHSECPASEKVVPRDTPNTGPKEVREY